MKQFKSIFSSLSNVLSALLIVVWFGCNDTSDPALYEETVYEVPYGDDPLQKFDIYLPANRTSDTKVLIFLHGGGWNAGDKSDYVLPLSGLHGHDFAIANVNYRLADQTAGITLPDLAADVLAAIDYIQLKSNNFVISPDNLILAGHSAGGHLALYTAYHNNASGKIKAVISMAGPADLTDDYFLNTPDLNALIENLMGTTYLADTTGWINGSPVTWVSAAAPPTLLQYCSLDTTVPVVQGDIVNTALTNSGTEHSYTIYPLYGHDMGTIFNGGFLPSDVQNDIINFVDANAN